MASSPVQGGSGKLRETSTYRGSHGALTEELHEKRVGGAGRLHIFHLPEARHFAVQKVIYLSGCCSVWQGKDSLATQLPKVAGRRDSVSALVPSQQQGTLFIGFVELACGACSPSLHARYS